MGLFGRGTRWKAAIFGEPKKWANGDKMKTGAEKRRSFEPRQSVFGDQIARRRRQHRHGLLRKFAVQGVEERDDILDFIILQIFVELGFGHHPHRFVQALDRAIVEIGRGVGEIAQRLYPIHLLVLGLVGDGGAALVLQQPVLGVVDAAGEGGKLHEKALTHRHVLRAVEGRTGMARRAAGLGEGVHAPHLLLGHRFFVAFDVAVVGAIGRDQGALVGRDSLGGVIHSHDVTLAERRFKMRFVARNLLDAPDGGIQVLHAHFDGVGRRAFGLLLQGRRASVPKLGRIEGRVPNGRSVATADLAVHPDGGGTVIVAAFHHVVTGKAGDVAGGGKAGIEIQHFPERHLGLGGGVVGWRRGGFRQGLPLTVGGKSHAGQCRHAEKPWSKTDPHHFPLIVCVQKWLDGLFD